MKQRIRKNKTFLCVVRVTAIVCALLYWEQAAVLYVLSTLALTALLIVVAFSDLEGARNPSNVPAPADDSAGIGDGMTDPLQTTASGDGS